VKKSCRKVKQLYLENKASEAEAAAKIGNSKALCRIVTELSGSASRSRAPIKDDNRKTISTHDEQLQQWKHHFDIVLNCSEPTILYDFTSVATPQLDICTDDISITEVQVAIKKLENNKAASIDNILAEYLKGGGDVVAESFTNICNQV